MQLLLPAVPVRRLSTAWDRLRLRLAVRTARRQVRGLTTCATEIIGSPNFNSNQLDPLVQEADCCCGEVARRFGLCVEDVYRRVPESRLLRAMRDATEGRTKVQMRLAFIVVQPQFPTDR